MRLTISVKIHNSKAVQRALPLHIYPFLLVRLLPGGCTLGFSWKTRQIWTSDEAAESLHTPGSRGEFFSETSTEHRGG